MVNVIYAVLIMLGGLWLFNFIKEVGKPRKPPKKPLDETDTYLFFYDD
jgi:hypothetical protein